MTEPKKELAPPSTDVEIQPMAVSISSLPQLPLGVTPAEKAEVGARSTSSSNEVVRRREKYFIQGNFSMMRYTSK